MQILNTRIFISNSRYAVILFKLQWYGSGKNKVNRENDNFGFGAQEKAPNDFSNQNLINEHGWIDKFSFISFPILFLVFNVFYWTLLIS